VLSRQVAPKLQRCSFRPGEVIYPPEELPLMVHCVIQGQVRILGPSSHQSPTLAVKGRGTVVGWDSLLRRVPVGSVRAALVSANDGTDQEMVTIALSADEFETLACQHLMPFLTEQVSLLELSDTVSRYLTKMPTRFSLEKLKDIIQYIDREQLATVRNWYPNSALDNTLEAAALNLSTFYLPDDRIWLFSGGALLSIPIGTQVETINQLAPLRSSIFPVRLLGIDRHFWESTVHQGIMPGAIAPRQSQNGAPAEANCATADRPAAAATKSPCKAAGYRGG